MSIVTANLWALKNRLKFIILLFIGIGAVLPSGASAQTFNDVPTEHWAYSFIETLVGNGITAGCGNGNYCPDAPVTRDQMAVFLVKAFGL